MKQELRICARFLQRDFQIYREMIPRYIINNVIILPLLIILAEGYLIQNTLFGSNAGMNTMRFAGSLFLPLLTLTFNLSMPILFDLEHDRFINYQISVLNPRWVIFERIIFTTLFTFCLLAPFYPLAKLLLGTQFTTDNTSWPALFCILFIASFTASAYHVLAMIVLPGSHLFIRLWSRVSSPLFLLGGLSVPWSIIHDFYPPLAYGMLLNPFMYISEGIRQAILGGPHFFKISTCVTILLLFSAIFYSATLWFFKRRVDHI